MNLWNVFLGSSTALEDAERKLIDWEDEIFSKPAEDETVSLANHVPAEMARFKAQNIRSRFNQAATDRRLSRIMFVMLLGFGVLGAKAFGILNPLLKILGAL